MGSYPARIFGLLKVSDYAYGVWSGTQSKGISGISIVFFIQIDAHGVEFTERHHELQSVSEIALALDWIL
jgi:hypothetical protein